MFINPRTLDPCYVGELILLSLTLPDVVGIEAKVMGDGAYELCDVVRVKFDRVDTADSHTWPEEVGLIILVNIDMRVESLAPAVLEVGSAFPLSEDFVRPQRVVGNPDVHAVTSHVELAVVRAYVRSNRNICHIVKLPIEHVRRNPTSATSAEHVVFAFPLQNTYVSRGTSLTYFHRKRVAVACIFA